MLSVSVDEKSERAVKEYTIENGPLLLLSSPLSGFRRSTTSSLSSTLKQATFHVFLNQVKIGKIEKLSNWERIGSFLVIFCYHPQ